MKRITHSMIAKGGKRYCRVCKNKAYGRVQATWLHRGDAYCDEHKPKPTPAAEHYSEADYQSWLRV
jgi:hypothetical protein